MGRRSKVMSLPKEVRDQLDQKLIHGGFQNYEGLSEWLESQGFEISSSSVHRYGSQFEKRLAALKVATDQARAVSEAVGDEEGMLGDALTTLVQQKAFDVLVDMEVDPDEMSLTDLGHMIARLNKTAVSQKKWISEVREKARETAEEVADEAREHGLSDEAAAAIKAKILGITG